MDVSEAWNKFIENGSPICYIEYSKLKTQEANNANIYQGSCNQGDGCQGK